MKLVLCTDRRSGGALGSAETALKNRTIKKGWRALTAGTEPDILALIQLYRVRFRDDKNLAPDRIDESMKWPLFERKKLLADEYVRNRFAISHDEFIKEGKTKLPDEIYRNAIHEIAELNLKADLMVAGFVVGYPEIYECDSFGKASATDDYAAIGSGAHLAHAALLRRGQNSMTSLNATLYNVYEAKRQSESVGTVGRQTSFSVLSAEANFVQFVSGSMLMKLETMYAEYGPKPLPDNLEFEGTQIFDEEKDPK